MQEKLEKTNFGALVVLLAAVALPAGAITLGEAQVRSALGEPLDARIPVKVAEGESIERSCFSMLSQNDAGLPGVGDGSVSIERTRGAAMLRLRTFAPVLEPAVAMKVRAACANATEPAFVREYVLLLDPPAGGMRVPPEAGATAQAQAPARGILATILARIGDTLESLARAIVPDHRNARRDYIAAMRASNPSLQSLSDTDPIPEGMAVALPDMRLATRMSAPAKAPAEPKAPAARAPRAAREAPAAQPARERPPRSSAPAQTATGRSAPADAPAPAPRVEPKRRDPGFVLKLSNPDIDLSRTARIDEPGRQRLRERQLILDADDQVSALLAMRNSLKQLETRVAELQLKLAAMPPALATMTPPERTAKAAPPEVVPPPKAAPVQPPVAAVEPPKPKVEAPPAIVEAPKPVIEAPKAVVEPPRAAEPPPVATAAINPPTVPEAAPPVKPEPAATTAERKTAPRAIARQPGTASDTMPWLWALVALLAALALWLALRITRRRRVESDEVATTDYLEPEIGATEAIEPAVVREPARVARTEEQPALASDAPLVTRFAENSGELRRRYIEERFPEIASGAIALEDPDSVVKGARLFYEDGALPRAVELLQFAVEDRPGEVKPWLALFEIFRLESLTGQYAELATRFQKQHGASDYWRKVKFFGREIDSRNALYREDAVNTLETIGPREARRVAAANAPVDPIAENWLAAPMDFENEVLANDLRRSLLAQARLTDQDLQPNPMPALRNVEMFTVA